jgi:hypothetical protein
LKGKFSGFFWNNGEEAILEVSGTSFRLKTKFGKTGDQVSCYQKMGQMQRNVSKLSLKYFESWKFHWRLNDFFFVFFEGWPTISSKNDTNNVFNKMVQSHRVFIHGRKFYVEKSKLEKWVTRFTKNMANLKKKIGVLVEKTDKFQWIVFIFF